MSSAVTNPAARRRRNLPAWPVGRPLRAWQQAAAEGVQAYAGASLAAMRPEIPDWPPGTVAVLSTAGPHAIPVSTAMRAGPSSVLLALGPNRGSLARLRADPQCALAVIAENLAVTLRGRATVAGDAAGTVAVRLDVEAVDDHAQPTFAVEAGVRWRWTDAEAERRDGEVRAALRQLA